MSTDCFDSDETLADTENCLSDIIGLISKLSRKIQKVIGEYQMFNISSGRVVGTKLCDIHRGSEKLTLFSLASGFTRQIFTGELSGVDSARALRQSV